MSHTFEYLVRITTDRERLDALDVSAALVGTGNACADPRYDVVEVRAVDPAEIPHTVTLGDWETAQPRTAPPLRRYVGYLCAACGQMHGFDEPCLAGAG